MAELTILSSGFEKPNPGTYPATFTKFEDFVTEKGPCFRWVFILDAGKTVSALSSQNVTDRNKTGRWLAGLAGKPVVAGLAIDPAAYFGKKYMLVYDGNGLLSLTPIAS